MRDPAFQSQVFAQNSNQRAERYTLMQGEALMQGLPGIVDAYARHRDARQGYDIRNMDAYARHRDARQGYDIRNMEAQQSFQQSQIQAGLDAIRADQMREELAWARELHSTDMLAAQRRQMIAQTELIEAQTKKQLKQLDDDEDDNIPRGFGFSEEELLSLEVRGMGIDLSSRGRPRIVQGIPEDRIEAARKRMAELDAIRRRPVDPLTEYLERGGVAMPSSSGVDLPTDNGSGVNLPVRGATESKAPTPLPEPTSKEEPKVETPEDLTDDEVRTMAVRLMQLDPNWRQPSEGGFPGFVNGVDNAAANLKAHIERGYYLTKGKHGQDGRALSLDEYLELTMEMLSQPDEETKKLRDIVLNGRRAAR